jgi:hypothetical protein
VVFQEFSKEERCRAKSKIKESLKDAGTKLRVGLEELKRVGKAVPGQIREWRLAAGGQALARNMIGNVRTAVLHPVLAASA